MAFTVRRSRQNSDQSESARGKHPYITYSPQRNYIDFTFHMPGESVNSSLSMFEGFGTVYNRAGMLQVCSEKYMLNAKNKKQLTK